MVHYSGGATTEHLFIRQSDKISEVGLKCLEFLEISVVVSKLRAAMSESERTASLAVAYGVRVGR
jgi:hypothetical protein